MLTKTVASQSSELPLAYSPMCSWCQSIFVGPLRPTLEAEELPIRVDAWKHSPESVVPSPQTPNVADYGDSVESFRNKRPVGLSSVHSNRPRTLYMMGYKFIHMSTGFEESDFDVKEAIDHESAVLEGSPYERPANGSSDVWRRYGTHHTSAWSFIDALVDGCRICSQIRNAIPNLSTNDLATLRTFDTGFTTYGIYYFPQYGTSWIVFHLGTAFDKNLGFDPQKTILHLHCRPDAYFDRYMDEESDRNRIPRSSTFDLDKISYWISKCDQMHDCCDPTPNTFYPTRLLSLGRHPDSVIKLVLTKKTPIDNHYATLSYRWGSGVSVKLLSHLVSDFETGISLNSLPRTLKEAIQVSRKIGIHYLWVDSLCIIQDSEEDWNHESSQMADIYSNSYCNFAATSSRSCHEGLFSRASTHELVGPIFVQSDWESVGSVRVGLWDPELFIRSVERSPLNGRGWVLQERFLSPRTVHFARNQIFWECCKRIACEVYSDGLIPGYAVTILKRRLTARTLSSSTPNKEGNDTHEDLNTYWSTLLNIYSSTDLTIETDKMPAISGIARKIQSITSEDYVAGLWANRFPSQLLWGVSTPGSRTGTHLGPSWSWASIIGDIRPWPSSNGEESISLVSIVDYNVDYKTTVRFGQILSGTLRLSGRLYPSLLIPYSSENWRVYFQDGELNNTRYAKPVYMDEKPTKDENTVYCLPVMLSSNNVGCLLLKPTGKSKGEYVRLGSYESHHKEDIAILGRCLKPYIRDPDLYAENSIITLV